jgi:class I fructose-bisphosphate aldolase
MAGPSDDTVNAIAGTIRSGARGVIVGRNIWQREHSVGQQVLAEIAAITRQRRFDD